MVQFENQRGLAPLASYTDQWHISRMTAKRLPRPRDPVQLGKLIGDILTGQVEDRAPPSKADEGKDPVAVALGRKGGLKGGRARADALTAEQRKTAAQHAARRRWGTPETK